MDLLVSSSFCAAAVLVNEADVVIDAATWAARDVTEAEEAAPTIVTGAAPCAIAKAGGAKGIPVMQVSTNYVFDGVGEICEKRDCSHGTWHKQ
jgi:dTDP-4-dehydrorhamnose reductase